MHGRVIVIILFDTRELEQLCNDERVAKKKLGAAGAKKLKKRLDDLDAMTTLEAARSLPGRCHELKGDLLGCLAITVDGGCRLVFRPEHEPVPVKKDGGLDWRAVTSVRVVAVRDYHDD